jgi:hypothetical protein
MYRQLYDNQNFRNDQNEKYFTNKKFSCADHPINGGPRFFIGRNPEIFVFGAYPSRAVAPLVHSGFLSPCFSMENLYYTPNRDWVKTETFIKRKKNLPVAGRAAMYEQ